MNRRLVELTPELAGRVVAWVADREAVVMFGGRALPHPLSGADLLATADDGWELFALLDDGQVVGTGSVRRVDAHTTRIGRVLLDPARRGQGLGRELFRQLLERATADPRVTTVTLAVFQHNLPALRLYQSLGFVETGEVRTLHVEGRDWAGLELRLDLP